MTEVARAGGTPQILSAIIPQDPCNIPEETEESVSGARHRLLQPQALLLPLFICISYPTSISLEVVSFLCVWYLLNSLSINDAVT